MDFSIIVPVFNTETDKLERCFRSVLEIETDFECLIIDDGSKEFTSIFCVEFCKENKKFKYFRQQNAGVAVARNYGIKVALGKYICFVDSDDEVISEAFKQKYFLMDYDVILTDLILIHGNNKIIWKALYNGDTSYESIIRRLVKDGKLNGPVCKFIKKTFLIDNNILFEEDMFEGEDANFFKNIMLKTPKIKYVPEVSYIYYKYPISLQNRIQRYRTRYFDIISRQYIKSLECINIGRFNALEIERMYYQLKSNYIGYIFAIISEAIKYRVFDQEFKDELYLTINKLDIGDIKKIGFSEKIYYRLFKKKSWFLLWILSDIRNIYINIKGLR